MKHKHKSKYVRKRITILTKESSKTSQDGWDQVDCHVAVAEKSSHLKMIFNRDSKDLFKNAQVNVKEYIKLA